MHHHDGSWNRPRGLDCSALRNVPLILQTINNVLAERVEVAEVSVAMTYIDNNAYAMAQFERPENITAAPELAPHIYFDNVRFSTDTSMPFVSKFFKRLEYDPKQCNLQGWTSNNCLRAGTFDAFWEAFPEYSLDRFLNWLSSIHLTQRNSLP